MEPFDEGRGHRDPAAALRPRRWPLALAAALIAGAAGLLYWRFAASPGPAEPETSAAQAAAAPTSDASPAPLPALGPAEQTDPLVREVLGRLLQERAIEQWLKSGDLIRRFVAAVDAVADGESPRASLSFLAPAGAFAIRRDGGRTVIDERSYQRYAPFALAIRALDPKACAAAYARLSPLLESAHAEIGRPGTTFASALAKAIGRLARAPVPQGPVAVDSPKVLYQFADPSLESLSPAEKQLLRLGPDHARALQEKLAAIAAAIGLPQ